MAYALESLSMILKQVLNPYNQQYLILDHKLQIQSLLEKVNILKNYLTTMEIIDILESRMVIASQRGEDIIEAHMSDRILSSISTHLLDLKYLMEEFDSIKDEILKEFDPPPVLLPHNLNSPLVVSSSSSSPDPEPSLGNILVGMEDRVDQLRDVITRQQSQLQEIAIVGKGGMGKTTLARKLYNDLSVTNHFDTRLWITISMNFTLRDSLLSLLESLRKLTSRMQRESDDELVKHIYKAIRGTRYLIVVDDIWQIGEWQVLRRFFPDDGNGSRILLTTRLRSVARHSTVAHYVRFLTLDECWKLLCLKVFAREHCPPEFEEIGKRICELCNGHPLTIIVIAGILLTSKTRHFWEFVAENIKSISVGLKSVIEALNMGYNHLPHYLKPCFLYMGAFREDREIGASEIIRLWVAEGFIIPIANKTLEETAEDYLRALIHRNLLMVCEQDTNGKVKTLSIHGLLRNVSKKFAAKENFLMVNHRGAPNIPKDTMIMCRSEINDDIELMMTLARSSLYFGPASNVLNPVILGLRLLRILDVLKIELHQFPMEILQLVNLRYLAFTCRSALPPSISRFWNLQTLIIGRLPSFRAFALPSQVWEMTQLRHIKSKKACIWYCPGNGKNIIQEDLQTLTNIQLCGVTNEVLEKFPNLKKLGVFCNVALYDVFDLASLLKLETLKCSSDWSMVTRDFLSYLTFPPSLKKLTLSLCKIPLGFMATVGSLPNLEQLKLQKSDFIGIELEPIGPESEPIEPESEPIEPEWETREGEFPRLISLLMEDLNLVHWTSCGTNFPRLKRLVVRECCSLEKIPCNIGYIPTIELIEVDESSPSVLASAMRIEKEQKDLGNELLQVVVYRS
ncbi:hypothetical protein ACJIZ3_024223 [Penstemon smallii]|uniref:NB-ARC domain-containing protein n=1 Tax=Penstemon smallii TaxID=265156 RepID=A0ABD3TTM3_9LAMI